MGHQLISIISLSRSWVELGNRPGDTHPSPLRTKRDVLGSLAESERLISVNWLPELVPQSVIRDVFEARLSSLARWVRGKARLRKQAGNTAAEWQRALDKGRTKNRADLARRLGLSTSADHSGAGSSSRQLTSVEALAAAAPDP